MFFRAGTLAAVLAVVLSSSAAWADLPAISNGRAHWMGARFEQAETAFESVLQDAGASRADLVEALRHLAVVRLLRDLRADAAQAAERAVSLDRGVTPPEGSPPNAAALFDEARTRVPPGGLQCSLQLPPRPVASSPVGARVRVVGDVGGLTATASLSCGGRELRGTPVPGERGEAVAELAVDGGPAGRRTDCTARLLTSVNVVLATASGSFVARASSEALGGEGGGGTDVVPRVPGPGRRRDDEGGGFPWVWVGVGAGVVAVGVAAAVLLTSGSDEAYLGAPTIVGAQE